MNKLKKIFLLIGVSYACLLLLDLFYVRIFGQTPAQTLTVVLYSNITSASRLDGCDPSHPCIDNRSQFTRSSSTSSFRAFGTGTWSVDMQWADVTPTAWTSFGSTAQVNQAGPSSGIGYGIGPGSIQKPYHDYIRFVFTGNATIMNYTGTRQFWWLPSVAAIAFPITANQGGTYGLFYPDVLANSLPAACASAKSLGEVLMITESWSGLSTQTLNCASTIWDGVVAPGSGQVVTFSQNPQSCTAGSYNVTTGGAGSIRFASDPSNAGSNAACFGADPTGATDSATAIQAAIQAAETPGAGSPISTTTFIVIPPGSYKLLSGLIEKAWGTRMYGAGQLSSTLSYQGTDPNAILLSWRGFFGELSKLHIENGAASWSSGINYEGSQSSFHDLFVECASNTTGTHGLGDGITQSKEGVGQSDQLIQTNVTIGNCEHGYAWRNFLPNSLSNVINKGSIYNSLVGVRSAGSTNLALYGSELDDNGINFWPGLGTSTTISNVRSEGSKRGVYTTPGAAQGPFTMSEYFSASVNDTRPSSTVTASSGATVITLPADNTPGYATPGWVFGDWIKIIGADTGGGDLYTFVTGVAPNLTSITIAEPIVTSVTGAAVTLANDYPTHPQDQYIVSNSGPYTFSGNVFSNFYQSGDATKVQTISFNSFGTIILSGNTFIGLGQLINGPFGNGQLPVNSRITGNYIDDTTNSGTAYHMFDYNGIAPQQTLFSRLGGTLITGANNTITVVTPENFFGTIYVPPVNGLALTAPIGGLTLQAGANTIAYPSMVYPATTVTSGVYRSGATVTGSSTQTCTVTFSTGAGTATVALTGTNAIAAGTALTITAGGSYQIAPNSATLSSGSATCSGTVAIATRLTGTVYSILSHQTGGNITIPYVNGGVPQLLFQGGVFYDLSQ